ncbi:Hypothetical predicted protein [Olea europaea subsp. europaea]|uniref:Uncharacterized protein n=1 Tax=Olea europaea subsp. europaea TaxID=158383 RepID=A0A8S0SZJ6_OLEEU|nr:Hypothetical predicted protein [Olea europaea subsp. europaea]
MEIGITYIYIYPLQLAERTFWEGELQPAKYNTSEEFLTAGQKFNCGLLGLIGRRPDTQLDKSIEKRVEHRGKPKADLEARIEAVGNYYIYIHTNIRQLEEVELRSSSWDYN